MLLVAPVREDKRDVLPAITHEDGSGRLQTVYQKYAPGYHRLIERFGEITGVPVIMNTSFNLKGEPIVSSPVMAVATFMRCGLDVLYVGSYRIDKADMRGLDRVGQTTTE